MREYHKLNPLRYGRRLEQRFRRWRRRLPFRFQQRRIARAYANFDVGEVLQHCRRQPVYSIVVPVFRAEPKWLRRCIESVLQQLYPHWELILVDDGSKSKSIDEILRTYAARDPRIRAFSLPRNQGISAATNHAIAQAQGEFLGFLDHDDELTPDALLWMVVAHNRHPRSKWFYSNEAILELDGNYVGRFHLKPAYSSEHLLSVMYPCHFTVYRRELVERVGRLRSKFDGAQDHDLALRIADHVSRDEVTHIPQTLYFWRATPQSTASDVKTKPAAPLAGYRAVCEAVGRRRLPCEVSPDPVIPTLFHLKLELRETPKVSVIIPTRNACRLLRRCLESLQSATNYPNYEIIVIDNQSDEPELLQYLRRQETQAGLRTFRYDKPFNHSEMHNQVIATLDSELVVLANNDLYDFSPGWLEQLVSTVQLDEKIAGAGGKLLFPNGTIQHAGVVVGVAGLAGNTCYGVPKDQPGYLGRDRSLQDVAAVTGALMILRKDAFEAVGGFDAQRFPTSYNDVDLWMRLTEKAYRCLYNPEVQAVHEESCTRGVPENELEYRRRLQENLTRSQYVDPYWDLAIFDDHATRVRREATAQWVLSKVNSLREQAASLSDPAMAGDAGPMPSVDSSSGADHQAA